MMSPFEIISGSNNLMPIRNEQTPAAEKGNMLWPTLPASVIDTPMIELCKVIVVYIG